MLAHQSVATLADYRHSAVSRCATSPFAAGGRRPRRRVRPESFCAGWPTASGIQIRGAQLFQGTTCRRPCADELRQRDGARSRFRSSRSPAHWLRRATRWPPWARTCPRCWRTCSGPLQAGFLPATDATPSARQTAEQIHRMVERIAGEFRTSVDFVRGLYEYAVLRTSTTRPAAPFPVINTCRVHRESPHRLHTALRDHDIKVDLPRSSEFPGRVLDHHVHDDDRLLSSKAVRWSFWNVYGHPTQARPDMTFPRNTACTSACSPSECGTTIRHHA